eukprot:1600331-Lingulodinium_polyedra.AAC.1
MLRPTPNVSEDGGRETLDLTVVASLLDAQQMYWASRSAKRAWRRATRKGARQFRRLAKRTSRKGRGKGNSSSPA